ncbi:MAG: aspartate carbamoyltransferase catalytic subunit [Bdellovibrionales bacterium]|nr:aspartate carbamoyltransferase catalytic subunit [Bdellovibrionales bacterium]
MSMIGRHLLGINGLTREQVEYLLTTAEQFVEVSTRNVKKVPTLRGKTVINLFLEASTRTRSSFEIAGKRMSADVVNVSGSSSSTTKGETLIDTALTLESMDPDVVVIRHASSGAAHLIAKHLTRASVINAGDGLHEHPSQALLDALTMRQAFGTIEGLTVTIVGDVLRSRVARSNIHLLRLFGCSVRVVAPPTLAKKAEFEALGCQVFYHMPEALEGADVVMSLRMKHEYLKDLFVPNLDEYSRKYIVSEPMLARYAPNCKVLAPGPIIRGTEITSEVADGPRSLISRQVTNGVAVRMALLYVLGARRSDAARERDEEIEPLGLEAEASS